MTIDNKNKLILEKKICSTNKKNLRKKKVICATIKIQSEKNV